jgi:hypothetical protein
MTSSLAKFTDLASFEASHSTAKTGLEGARLKRFRCLEALDQFQPCIAWQASLPHGGVRVNGSGRTSRIYLVGLHQKLRGRN